MPGKVVITERQQDVLQVMSRSHGGKKLSRHRIATNIRPSMIGFGVFTLFSIFMEFVMSLNSGGQGQGDGNVALRCIGNVKARVSSGNHKCLLPCIQRRRRNEVVLVLSARERLSSRGQLYGVREYHPVCI